MLHIQCIWCICICCIFNVVSVQINFVTSRTRFQGKKKPRNKLSSFSFVILYHSMKRRLLSWKPRSLQKSLTISPTPLVAWNFAKYFSLTTKIKVANVFLKNKKVLKKIKKPATRATDFFFQSPCLAEKLTNLFAGPLKGSSHLTKNISLDLLKMWSRVSRSIVIKMKYVPIVFDSLVLYKGFKSIRKVALAGTKKGCGRFVLCSEK